MNTFSLFARPSFTEGVGRILDFGSTLSEYNRSETGEEADSLALYSDWRMIGMDIENAMVQCWQTQEGVRLVEKEKSPAGRAVRSI